jgi:hypothetical protein
MYATMSEKLRQSEVEISQLLLQSDNATSSINRFLSFRSAYHYLVKGVVFINKLS